MELTIPFQRKASAHQSAAEASNLDWLQAHNMLRGREATELYARWAVPDLAARSFPEADCEDLVLATDLFGFYFLFDDQFDSELGLHPTEVARICDPLIGIVHGDFAGAKASPVAAAFADLWHRSSAGMSTRWRARASYNWEWYFASHPSEALGRARAAAAERDGGNQELPDRASYLTLRRGTGGTETVIDMIERFASEVPPTAFHSPPLRLMRQLAADIPSFSNDVRSYRKEAPRGDAYNLVVILQHQRQCGVEEAGAAVLAETQWMIDEYTRLAVEIPELCTRLGLDGPQRRAVERYADGLASWVAGYLDWEGHTLRYRPEGELPADRPNHLEQLLDHGW
ncbi:pentalenene synthase [Streptacidiphilus sp. MAP12-16]|uniref:terpene synthase family protein n=1 Tax=Streptacidiphilus sp. MAP12-16 TaxID=3156300 RepID=UPI0035119C2F